MGYIVQSGTEPSSVILYKPATKARQVSCNFENFHKDSLNQTGPNNKKYF